MVWPTGVVPSQHAYSGQDAASLFPSSSLVWAVFEPGEGSAFLRGLGEIPGFWTRLEMIFGRTLCSDLVVTSVLHPWDFIARARSLGNLEKHVALASFRSISGYIARKAYSGNKPASLDVEFSIFSGSFAGGGAAVFPALGQDSFRGTTPTELDEYSKACEPDRKVLCAASEPFIFSMGRSYEPGRIGGIDASGLSTDLHVCDDYPWLGILNPTFVETRDQLDPRNVEAGFEVVTWSRGEPNIIEGRFQAGTGSRQGPGTVEVILEEWSLSQQEPKTVEV
ncbi:LOW QUALITY PROTEIN: hypothetical protein HID58_042637 [Brassica napus]|uniref:Uncharacterized protein n=1 Tax=Brassica napus TaxID=3708 RepID=A0ABQ8BEA5_BRANA|nr:LOW QUALITY PROTEIN: hypothetical protein HID58_042637 [Brassica napus]